MDKWRGTNWCCNELSAKQLFWQELFLRGEGKEASSAQFFLRSSCLVIGVELATCWAGTSFSDSNAHNTSLLLSWRLFRWDFLPEQRAPAETVVPRELPGLLWSLGQWGGPDLVWQANDGEDGGVRHHFWGGRSLPASSVWRLHGARCQCQSIPSNWQPG